MERMDFSYWIRHILCTYRFNATLITSCGLIQPHHQPVDYPALTSKVASYVKATSPQTWRKISRNFAQTPIKRFEPRDKAYYNDKLLDHACPMTIRWFQKSLSLGIVKSKFLTVNLFRIQGRHWTTEASHPRRHRHRLCQVWYRCTGLSWLSPRHHFQDTEQ